MNDYRVFHQGLTGQGVFQASVWITADSFDFDSDEDFVLAEAEKPSKDQLAEREVETVGWIKKRGLVLLIRDNAPTKPESPPTVEPLKPDMVG